MSQTLNTMYDLVGTPSPAKMSASTIRNQSQAPDGSNVDRATAVRFTIKGFNVPVWAIVNSLQREDGSGHSFNVEGYGLNSNPKQFSGKFKAYCNCRTNSGTITFE